LALELEFVCFIHCFIYLFIATLFLSPLQGKKEIVQDYGSLSNRYDMKLIKLAGGFSIWLMQQLLTY